MVSAARYGQIFVLNMSSGEQLVKDEIDFIKSNLCEAHFDNDHGYGFLDGTEEQKEEFIDKFTALNSTCFVRSRTDVKKRSQKTSENIQPVFEQKSGNLPINCVSHPFLVISMETRNCIHGPLADSRGGKRKETQNTSEHDYSVGSGGYIKVQGTRKLDCPATLQVRAIRLYTDYTLAVNEYSSKKSVRKAKASILDQLKNDVQTGKHLGTSRRYYFKLPLSTVHKEHPVGEAGTVGHSMHSKIVQKIHELVSENITNPDEVRKCVEQYIHKELFQGDPAQQQPSKSNRRYYPSRQDLRSHIARAISASEYSTKARRRLLERTDVLRSAALVADDSTTLENAISMVDAVISELQRSSPRENSLPLRQSPVKKKIKITEVDYHKVIHRQLPAQRQHGKRRKDRGVVVDLGKAATSQDNVIELGEIDSVCEVPLDDDDDGDDDTDFELTRDAGECTAMADEKTTRIPASGGISVFAM